MPTETLLARRSGIQQIAQAFQGRQNALWDTVIQTDPGTVYRAALRGLPIAQAAVRKHEANKILYGTLPRINEATPLFDAVVPTQPESIQAAYPVKKKRTNAEIAADSDHFVETASPERIQKAAAKNAQVVAALERKAEREATTEIPEVNIEPPTKPGRGRLKNVFINQNAFSQGTSLEDQMLEWTKQEAERKIAIEQLILLEASFAGYAAIAERKVQSPIDYMNIFHALIVNQNISPALFNLYMSTSAKLPKTPEIITPRQIRDMRTIGSRSAQLRLTPLQAIGIMQQVAATPEAIEPMSKIYQKATTIDEVYQAIQERRFGLPEPRIK